MVHRRPPARRAWVLGLACAAAVGAPAAAAGADKAPEERRAAVARCLSPAGSLLERPAPDKPWQLPAAQDRVFSRDLLLALPGQRAELDAANGAVRLVLWGNLPQLSRSAVLESAVVLHDNPAFDLDLTLERGRIVLLSTKDTESARVRVGVPGETWDITLKEKGDQAALEYYGRWPRGVGFSTKSQDRPTEDLALLQLKGTAELQAGPRLYTLRAPAYFHWDSAYGEDSGPRRLDQLPAWLGPDADRTPEAGTVRDLLDRLRERLAQKPVPEALADLRASADRDTDKARAAVARRFVVLALGATDDLPGLVDALTDAQHADVRDAAVEALRHWIGRGPGQDQRLYDLLVKRGDKYPDNILQLLHSPFQADQPVTYETLIDYLRHESLAVRELAVWHLYRLAPAGQDIAYDAAAPAEERDKAYKQWKELIPEGKLPPKPKSGPK